jgi:CRISPR-associated protein Csd1
MYQEQPIRYVISLNSDGGYLALLDTVDPTNTSTKRGVRRLAPHVKRAVGIRAKLLADTGEYVLGIPQAEARSARVRQQHEMFVELASACARAMDEPAVAAVARFLAEVEPSQLNLPADFDPGATLTFDVDGTYPIDLPRVRAYWATMQGAADIDEEAGSAGGRTTCLICGRVRPVLQRHPLKIKGIPGGQMSGTDLISANAKAYESYGLVNSLIAPTCHDCAEKYGNALNALLSDDDTHLRVGSQVFVFWTIEESTFRPGRLLSTPDAVEVASLLGAAWSGRAAAIEVDPLAFYALALSASGARVVVRNWIDTTVGEAKRRLGRYFALQALVGRDGAEGEWLSIRRLANATVRDPTKDTPDAAVVDGLAGLALGGRPLADDILFQVVRRLRADGRITRERMALVKMVLGSNPPRSREEVEAMTRLNVDHPNPAYHCGRLLSLLNDIQYQALGDVNATVVDKYYGGASATPGAVFGLLVKNANHHLAKMRSDAAKERAARAMQARLRDMMAAIPDFPETLNLRDQALFALGYYHQQAADRAAARERREAARAAPTSADGLEEVANDGGADEG